jgi:lysylphosphatidylglycerol synthetase-like protein (DUF2156 family)
METNYFTAFLKDLLIQSPIITVIIVGIILAIVRRRRHLTVSLFTIACLGFLLIHTIVFSVVFTFLPFFLYRMGSKPESYSSVFQIVSFISILIDAIIFALLLVAALMKRNEQNPNVEGQQT